jgi:uncharacterized protein
MSLEFEWNEEKAAANLEKHGVDFIDAAGIFTGYTMEAIDGREDYGEVRFQAIGKNGDQAYVVVFTVRGARLRIISAWKAGRNDRRRYEESLAARAGKDEGRNTR